MRLRIAFVLLILIQVPLLGQEDIDTIDSVEVVEAGPWSNGGNLTVNFNQVALSNWTGGGESMVAIGGIVNLYEKYEKEKVHWISEFNAEYGFTKISEIDFRKSNDNVAIVSKADYNATNTLLYSALLDFHTQFSGGSDFDIIDSLGNPLKVSGFMAPGYLNLGLGATWKPTGSFELFIAPISNRVVFVMDEELSAQGAYGVEPGERIDNNLGSTSRIDVRREIFENVTLGSRLTLFAPFKDYASIIVNWESILNMQVNDFISASISLDVRYDDKIDVSPGDGEVEAAVQVKEALSIGLGYSF